MNPADLVFKAFSDLTGGLVTDMYTAIIAMVGIIVLYAGATKLINFFQVQAMDSELISLNKKMGGNGDFYGDYNKRKYNRIMQMRLKKDMQGDL